MPLKIELKPGERAILNGAVIEGASDGRTEFVVLNRTSIMRERHILKEEDAQTPVRRLYFALQMMYIEPARKEDFLQSFDRYAKDLETNLTLPQLKFALEQIMLLTQSEQFYEALKICRAMIEAEDGLFEYGKIINQINEAKMPEVPEGVDFAALAARMKAEAEQKSQASA